MTQNPNDTGIRPVQDRVLVRRDPPVTTSAGGLALPEGSEDWPPFGLILAIGPRVLEEAIQPGRRCMFKSRPSSALIPDNREPGQRAVFERVVALREEDIVAIVEDES